MDGYDWIEIVGKQKFASWVRKQVDLINIVQSNRYGFPVVSALPAEGVPKASTQKINGPQGRLFFFYFFYMLKFSPRYTFFTCSSAVISRAVPCFKIFPSCKT